MCVFFLLYTNLLRKRDSELISETRLPALGDRQCRLYRVKIYITWNALSCQIVKCTHKQQYLNHTAHTPNICAKWRGIAWKEVCLYLISCYTKLVSVQFQCSTKENRNVKLSNTNYYELCECNFILKIKSITGNYSKHYRMNRLSLWNLLYLHGNVLTDCTVWCVNPAKWAPCYYLTSNESNRWAHNHENVT